jgi:phosphohistidine swiveling domain-containing protein
VSVNKVEKNLVDDVNFDREWIRKGFHGVLHTFFPVAEVPIKTLNDYYGDSFSVALFFVSNDYVNWYWNTEDMRRLGKSLIKKVETEAGFLDKLVADWNERLKAFDQAAGEIISTDLSKLDNMGLLDLYAKLYDAYLKEYALAIGFQEAFSLLADEFMLSRINEFLDKEGLGDYFVEYSSMLTAPVNESFITNGRRELLKMLEAIQGSESLLEIFNKEVSEIEEKLRDYPDLDQMLEKHSKEFFWVQNNYANIKILDKKFFIKELKVLLRENISASKELEKLDMQIPHTKEMKEKLMEDLNLPQDIRNLIKIVEVFTYMQDERKKYVLVCNHYQKLFMDEIGERLGLTYKEMAYTHFRELEDLLINGKIDKEKLNSRKRHCLCVHTLDGYQVLDGEQVDRIFNERFRIEPTGILEVKGMVASKGLASGVVKVVKKTHDLINVEKGDILVADMTRPEMVVAMEKAAAIITDEGGITCHAAIVSRELGIPCIVGTKIATTVLKDGDLVEVDANQGIVKKLSQ